MSQEEKKTTGYVISLPGPGSVSGWFMADANKIIRDAAAKYNVPIATLVREMIDPQLEHVERFALIIKQRRDKEDAELAERIARKKAEDEAKALEVKVASNEQLKQLGSLATLKQYKGVNLFEKTKHLEDGMNSLSQDMESIAQKLDKLLLALGEKNDVSRETSSNAHTT